MPPFYCKLKNNTGKWEKSGKENKGSIRVQCQPGPDYSFPLKQLGKKSVVIQHLLVQELFLASLSQGKGLSFLHVLHKT